jgi:chorismate mutase
VKKDLPSLRGRIDRLDDQIVRLLNERAQAALEVKRVKDGARMQVYAPTGRCRCIAEWPP